MNTSDLSELAALRQKLNRFEAEADGNRNVIEKLQTRNGVLAGIISDCLKVIAKLTIAKVEKPITTREDRS